MPTLTDFLGDRKVRDKGNYVLTLNEIETDDGQDRGKEYGTVQLKGEIDGSGVVIFRYLHPNCLQIIAGELIACGVDTSEEIDLKDMESVASAYGQFTGQALKVRCKVKQYEGQPKNEYFILGVANGAEAGRI